MAGIISFLVIVVAVYLIAVVTEDFFIVSLDKVATRLEMPSDVAGASLMAVGSSAPELAIALFAVILGGSHGDVGIGTIVGSAVFNILVITGASAIVAGELVINNRSVERDVAFYLLSVVLLLFVFFDGNILLWEIILLLGAYVVYLLVLWRWGNSQPKEAEVEHTPPEERDTGQANLLQRVHHLVARLFAVIARNPAEQYVWALIISIVAIALLGYVLVEAVVILANAIGLPPVIVSLTLLAAGTSAPDLIASVNVAREGRGSMAIANAVGSNIFDILVGLGLPWLIMLFFINPTIEVTTEGLVTSIMILGGTVFILYGFLYAGRSFTRREGLILLGIYVLYVIYEILTH